VTKNALAMEPDVYTRKIVESVTPVRAAYTKNIVAATVALTRAAMALKATTRPTCAIIIPKKMARLPSTRWRAASEPATSQATRPVSARPSDIQR